MQRTIALFPIEQQTPHGYPTVTERADDFMHAATRFTEACEQPFTSFFGSRAKENYKDGSNIDLAVIAPSMNDNTFTGYGMKSMRCRWSSKWICCTGID